MGLCTWQATIADNGTWKVQPNINGEYYDNQVSVHFVLPEHGLLTVE